MWARFKLWVTKFFSLDTYRIIRGGIQCLTCYQFSYDTNDIKHKYCPICKKYHEPNFYDEQ
jgi:hypothetical protein